ncbi:hypothetical protein QBC36DRAFT_288093, partial [Triangularia setosa]
MRLPPFSARTQAGYASLQQTKASLPVAIHGKLHLFNVSAHRWNLFQNSVALGGDFIGPPAKTRNDSKSPHFEIRQDDHDSVVDAGVAAACAKHFLNCPDRVRVVQDDFRYYTCLVADEYMKRQGGRPLGLDREQRGVAQFWHDGSGRLDMGPVAPEAEDEDGEELALVEKARKRWWGLRLGTKAKELIEERRTLWRKRTVKHTWDITGRKDYRHRRELLAAEEVMHLQDGARSRALDGLEIQ